MTDDYPELLMAIAGIISRGRHEDLSNVMIADDIIHMMRERAKSEIKPKRGIGWVSQRNLFNGR